MLQRAEAELVELARHRHPDEVAKRARWAIQADRTQHARRRARQRGNRGLSLRPRDDGLVHVDGALLPEVGEAWRTILEALVKATYREADARQTDGSTGPDAGATPVGVDSRTARQRMHDVFGELAQRVLAAGGLPEVHRAPAKVLVAIDLRDLDVGDEGVRWRLDALGIDVDRVRAAATGLLPRGSGLLPETGTLVPPEVVARLARQGADLIPLLFDGFMPLARGRTRRYADHHQRLGLIVRDHGCVDCAAPPLWCDADHEPLWDDGGRTDPDQLELRCRADHVARHRASQNGTSRAGESRAGASAPGPDPPEP